MPRKARIDAAGALRHIMIQGIERKPVFKDEYDRKAFLDRPVNCWKAFSKNLRNTLSARSS
jgi:hypothetical protein